MISIIDKIKEAGLLGRSGSMFPVAKKWEAVKSSDSEKKYVICNASEGEIDTFKDYYLLKNYPEDVIEGVKIAIKELGAKRGYIYLNAEYYVEMAENLQKIAGGDISVIEKKGGYIGGEETSVIEVIEGNSPEPRIKPPFPSESGLWGFPTLVNNVETFYCVTKINRGEYENNRFYSIGGAALKRGVFEFPEEVSIKKLLEETGNIPSFNYFVQVGGGAGGTVMLPDELEQPLKGLGSVLIYNREETDPCFLMREKVDFLLAGNCDKCTPCREGLYRIKEMIEEKRFKEMEEMFFVMEKTSLCPLGCVAVNPFLSILKKIVYEKNADNN